MPKQKTILEEEFWLYWGEAPEGTPKYNAGIKALYFISQKLLEIEQEILDKGHGGGNWRIVIMQVFDNHTKK